MKRQTTLLLATLLLGACTEAERAEAARPDAEPASPEPASPEPPGPEPSSPEPSSPEQPSAERSAGLELGARFAAFDIINSESGAQYCQICRYGPKPKIMAVGTIDDEAFARDLEQLDALVDTYGARGLSVFAVIAEPAEATSSKLVTPAADTRDELLTKAKALRARLQLSYPVVIPAPHEGGPNGIFEDHYGIEHSRTVLFTNKRNEVTYAAVAPADTHALDQAIQAALRG